jgi:hypothetical protein
VDDDPPLPGSNQSGERSYTHVPWASALVARGSIATLLKDR